MRKFMILIAAVLLPLLLSAQGPLETGTPEDNGMDGAKLSQVDRIFKEAKLNEVMWVRPLDRTNCS